MGPITFWLNMCIRRTEDEEEKYWLYNDLLLKINGEGSCGKLS